MRVLAAVAFAILIWIVGFVWGSIVFMTPALKATRAIPYVSNNPAISFPILLMWMFVSYFFARLYLRRVPNPDEEGVRLGFIFVAVNFILDVIVLVLLLKAGGRYFLSLTVWLGYLILLLIPWLTGRSLQKAVP